MADAFRYQYRPTAPMKFANLPTGVRWKWTESPRAFATNMLGVPPSKHEFGVIVTDREIDPHERNKANLEIHGEIVGFTDEVERRDEPDRRASN